MKIKNKLTSLLLSAMLPLTTLAATPAPIPTNPLPMPHSQTWESNLGNHNDIDQQLDESPTIQKAIEQGQHIEDLQYQKTLGQLENDIAALKATRALMAAQANAAVLQATLPKPSETKELPLPGTTTPSTPTVAEQPKEIPPVLQGVLIKDSLQLAVIRINNQQFTVQKGQKVGDYQVDNIQSDEVTLLSPDGKTKTLQLDTTS